MPDSIEQFHQDWVLRRAECNLDSVFEQLFQAANTSIEQARKLLGANDGIEYELEQSALNDGTPFVRVSRWVGEARHNMRCVHFFREGESIRIQCQPDKTTFVNCRWNSVDCQCDIFVSENKQEMERKLWKEMERNIWQICEMHLEPLLFER